MPDEDYVPLIFLELRDISVYNECPSLSAVSLKIL